MKKIFGLAIVILLLLQYNVEAQYNLHMTGNFDQGDSCSGYFAFQYSSVQIAASFSNSSDIIIHSFGGLVGTNVTATLDSVNHTVIIPMQTIGFVSVWGNGTFSANYNSMTLDFTID